MIPGHPRVMDLTGHKYGRLTVIEFGGKTKSVLWRCRCDCGMVLNVQANNLRSGHTRSCGCLQEETKGLHSVVHGETDSRAYNIWKTMKQRCQNPKHEKYHYYGGRGISVCERWQSFKNFLSDMGHPPEENQLDRIDNDGNYEPGNCRWVTRSQNMRKRRDTVYVTYKGERIPLVQLADNEGVPTHALRRRILYWGMTPEDAVEGAKNRRRRRSGKKTA